MAYTTAWTDDRPAGSEAAKNIDNEIRLLRQQISERMTGSLVEDWSADPVVAIGGVSGGGGSKSILIPFTSFIAHAPSEYPIYLNESILANYNCVLNASLILPYLSKIKSVEFLVNRNTCTSVTCALIGEIFNVGVALGVFSTLTTSAAGYNILASAPLDIEIDQIQMFFLQVSAIGAIGTAYNFAGARVLYTT